MGFNAELLFETRKSFCGVTSPGGGGYPIPMGVSRGMNSSPKINRGRVLMLE